MPRGICDFCLWLCLCLLFSVYAFVNLCLCVYAFVGLCIFVCVVMCMLTVSLRANMHRSLCAFVIPTVSLFVCTFICACLNASTNACTSVWCSCRCIHSYVHKYMHSLHSTFLLAHIHTLLVGAYACMSVLKQSRIKHTCISLPVPFLLPFSATLPHPGLLKNLFINQAPPSLLEWMTNEM